MTRSQEREILVKATLPPKASPPGATESADKESSMQVPSCSILFWIYTYIYVCHHIHVKIC